MISQIINGVQNISQNEPGLEEGVIRLLANGIKSQVSDVNRRNNYSKINETEERSVVICDRLGKLVTEY